MGRLSCLLSIFLGVFTPFCVVLVKCETYSVTINTDQYVNVVSKNFLSFTVDPKYLFSSGEKYDSQKCACMASSLTPAYLRIAGPSTAHMTLRNTTITIDNQIDVQPRKLFSHLLGKNKKRQAVEKLQVTSEQWIRFATWAKATGFEIVFAINNAERTKSGLWNPDSTLDILKVAEQAGIKGVFWQLGYECIDQTIDDYLNDLETLRVVAESFPKGGWRTGGGDVTGCLRAHSKSDFKDYVTLALDMSDAVLLDANSSSHELDRLSSPDRLRLLKLLHESTTPLWLTERPRNDAGLPRAADWMASLGYSARNGFAVHYRELGEQEMYQPTLSFYMALLFKNLVGERVLAVDIDASQAILFAHCTSLRRQPVPGAVTLYGVNMDDEPARLSLKLPSRDEGDILQFILSQEEDGTIIVNGREMSQEGDIRPVVKRVRAHKTLLINLPAKSFGFWVIANTKAEACINLKEAENKLVESVSVDETNESIDEDTKPKKLRSKRSPDTEDLNKYYVADITHFDESNDLKFENKEWNDKIADLNNYLKDVHRFLKSKVTSRTKRQMHEDNKITKKLRRQLLKTRSDLKLTGDDSRPILNFVEHLLQLTRRNGTKYANRVRQSLRLHKRKIGERHHKRKEENQVIGNNKKISRSRRSLENRHKSLYDDHEDQIKDNKIEIDDMEKKKMWKVLHSIQNQLDKITEETDRSQDSEKDDEMEPKSESDNLNAKTEILDESAKLNTDFSEKPNVGIFKATFEKLFSAIVELNSNLSRFWEAFTFFE